HLNCSEHEFSRNHQHQLEQAEDQNCLQLGSILYRRFLRSQRGATAQGDTFQRQQQRAKCSQIGWADPPPVMCTLKPLEHGGRSRADKTQPRQRCCRDSNAPHPYLNRLQSDNCKFSSKVKKKLESVGHFVEQVMNSLEDAM
ncbi:LOW QUALITY PROTEIN: hypothetical protein PanWU01x14_066130, partial [Parasponia andersonii]